MCVNQETVLSRDAVCADCGGDVGIYYLVPDALWDGLGYKLQDWACLDCLAKRLNPTNPATDPYLLAKEINRQKRKFALGKFIFYDEDYGMPVPLNPKPLPRGWYGGGLYIPTPEVIRRVAPEKIKSDNTMSALVCGGRGKRRAA